MKAIRKASRSQNLGKLLRPAMLWLGTQLLLLAHHASLDKVSAAEPQDDIGMFEKRLFFRQYAEDDVPTRLKRIETDIFGESYNDSISERLGRISNSLPSPAAPKSETTSGLPGIPAANVPPRSNAIVPLQTNGDNNGDLEEKRRMAALQARDEEVAHMLQEGVSLWHAKNGPAAIAKFRQVVRLDPQNAQGFYSLGVALEAKADFAEAERCYRKAAELEPGNNDFAQAIKALQKHSAMVKHFDSQEFELRKLAQNAAQEFQAGQYVSAIDLYKQLEKEKPSDPLTKYNMATTYMALNQPVTALDYLKQAAKLDPNDVKYKEAAKKLELSLKKVDAEKQAAEKAWEQTGSSQWSGAGNRGKQANYSNTLQPGAPQRDSKKNGADKPKLEEGPTFESDPLLFYGLHAKSSKEGVKVIEVASNSRALQVGLKTDDVIVAVDGAVIKNTGQLKDTILHKAQGQRFQLTVERNRKVGQILF